MLSPNPRRLCPLGLRSVSVHQTAMDTKRSTAPPGGTSIK